MALIVTLQLFFFTSFMMIHNMKFEKVYQPIACIAQAPISYNFINLQSFEEPSFSLTQTQFT